MEHIKAAIFDVDGTLFDYKERKIPDSVVAAVRKLKDRGITVIVASARAYPELSEDLLEKIDADYYVGSGGHSICSRFGHCLCSRRFTHDQVEHIVEIAEKFDAGLTLKYEDRTCLYRYPELMYEIFSNIGAPQCPSVVCRSMDAHREDLPIGFTLRAVGSTWEQIRSALEIYPGDFRIELFGNGVVADIYAPGTNKMTALADLVHRLGLCPENCIAFGDGHNDLEMIRWAGIGVAMGNAREELKAVADLICGATWEDGIARCLSTLSLID